MFAFADIQRRDYFSMLYVLSRQFNRLIHKQTNIAAYSNHESTANVIVVEVEKFSYFTLLLFVYNVDIKRIRETVGFLSY